MTETAGPFDNSCVLWFNQMRTTAYSAPGGIRTTRTRRRFFESRMGFWLRHARNTAAAMFQVAQETKLTGKAR